MQNIRPAYGMEERSAVNTEAIPLLHDSVSRTFIF